ncbi:BTB/POZ domain-containing protein 8-like [Mya arenaria]|uniref:BTB/POZ domain-containing protein 8-like n=1 Tax=Mya arenaria TaxID=6604 RepID=UPI0022E360B6|nr:BTB/POZ domain-containing protein 8-like [Mya arenaria]
MKSEVSGGSEEMSALERKCIAASDKVKMKQAGLLKEDMQRLYDEGTHGDLELSLVGKSHTLHACIIKARSLDVFKWLNSECEEGQVSLSQLTTDQQAVVNTCLRAFYTEDDLSEQLEKLCEVAKGTNTELHQEQTVSSETNSDVSRITVDGFENIKEISENITNASLDRVKKEGLVTSSNTYVGNVNERSMLVNNSKNIEAHAGDQQTAEVAAVNNYLEDVEANTDGHIIDIAKELVENAIGEAIGIVAAPKHMNSSSVVPLVDSNVVHRPDVETSSKVEENELEQTQNSENMFSNSCTASTTPLSAEFGNGVNSNNCVRGQAFRPTKDCCRWSIRDLLIQKFGLSTNVEPSSGLGADLLRLVLDGEGVDCVIHVNGNQIPAHRCILSARSEYFGAMLGGTWKEGRDIHLEDISLQNVHQMLLYLYGGCVALLPGVGLDSLTAVSGMYCMMGFTETIVFSLTKDYCHFFHKPCPTCIEGVPYTLAVAMMYTLEELKVKCVQWVNRNFNTMWGTRALLRLPVDVLEYCVKTAEADLKVDNVIDTLITCRQLNNKTPKLSWTEPLFDMVVQLMDAAIEFASKNFVNLISKTNLFKIDKKGLPFNKQPIEEIFSMIIAALNPENSCEAYLAIHKWVKTIETAQGETEGEKTSQYQPFSEEFVDLISVLFGKSRDQLCQYIHQVVDTQAWDLLSTDMQAEIKQAANYVHIDGTRPKMKRPKLSSDNRKRFSGSSGISLKEYIEGHGGHAVIPPINSKKQPCDVVRSKQVHSGQKGERMTGSQPRKTDKQVKQAISHNIENKTKKKTERKEKIEKKSDHQSEKDDVSDNFDFVADLEDIRRRVGDIELVNLPEPKHISLDRLIPLLSFTCVFGQQI